MPPLPPPPHTPRPPPPSVWAVLLGTQPARAFLWDGGVVVFGQQQQQSVGPGGSADAQQGQQSRTDTQQPPPEALVVNLWQQDRDASQPWDLHQLVHHLDTERGAGTAERLWARAQAVVSAALAACGTAFAAVKMASVSMSLEASTAVS